MLDAELLSQQFEEGIRSVIYPAIQAMELNRAPITNKFVEDFADKQAETFVNAIAKELADIFAQSIDQYIKNGNIHGWVMTTGSPVTQTAMIESEVELPTMKGYIPNTFGIS